MPDLAAFATLLSLPGTLGLDMASLSTAVADHLAFAVVVGAATFIAVTIAASATVAAAASPTSSRILVAPSIYSGVRGLSLVRFGFGSLTLS